MEKNASTVEWFLYKKRNRCYKYVIPFLTFFIAKGSAGLTAENWSTIKCTLTRIFAKLSISICLSQCNVQYLSKKIQLKLLIVLWTRARWRENDGPNIIEQRQYKKDLTLTIFFNLPRFLTHLFISLCGG